MNAQTSDVLQREIDRETKETIRVFLKRIEGGYPIVATLLFGSRARGTQFHDSDADLAVVMRGDGANRRARYKFSGEMAEVSFDVLLETGLAIQALPIWQSELQQAATFSNPALIDHIIRDGILL